MRLQTEFHTWVGLFQIMFPSPERTCSSAFLESKILQSTDIYKVSSSVPGTLQVLKKGQFLLIRVGFTGSLQGLISDFLQDSGISSCGFHGASSP